MRVHRNAKTTPKIRQLIVARAEQGWTYARIAEALGSVSAPSPSGSRGPDSRRACRTGRRGPIGSRGGSRRHLRLRWWPCGGAG